jgi:hypothetical protein
LFSRLQALGFSPGQKIEERGLTGARSAQQREKFSGSDFEGHVAYRGNDGFAQAILA